MGQRIIGLTGGIATGKTTVSLYLANHHGVPVLDADVFSREAVEPGSEILAAIAQRYGDTVLNPDGTLQRRRLGQIIFSDELEKQWVERQIHPFVRQRFAEEMKRLQTSSTVVQVIPLLFEANLVDQVTEVWVVTCPVESEVTRLMARDNLGQAAAQARLRNQWPIAQKAERADVVINNSTTLEALYQRVDQALHGSP